MIKRKMLCGAALDLSKPSPEAREAGQGWLGHTEAIP